MLRRIAGLRKICRDMQGNGVSGSSRQTESFPTECCRYALPVASKCIFCCVQACRRPESACGAVFCAFAARRKNVHEAHIFTCGIIRPENPQPRIFWGLTAPARRFSARAPCRTVFEKGAQIRSRVRPAPGMPLRLPVSGPGRRDIAHSAVFREP